MNTPSIRFEGYQFLAAVERAEDDFIVRSATNVELNGYSPDNMLCHACGKSIARQKTYLVRDSEGNMLQVGSTCVKRYFGERPEGLWALTYDPVEKLREDPEWDSMPRGRRDMAVNSDETLALALAASENGESFLSTSLANDLGLPSTADYVRNLIYGTGGDEAEKLQQRARDFIASGDVDRLREKMAALAENGDDYGRNMAVLSKSSYVDPKHLNLLVSAVSIVARERKQAQKRERLGELAEAPSKGFMGEPGTKLAGRKLRVISTRSIPGRDRYGRPVDRTKVVFRDEETHEVIWRASKRIEAKEGQEVTIGSGSVQKHDHWKGVDQTVVTRLRIDGW